MGLWVRSGYAMLIFVVSRKPSFSSRRLLARSRPAHGLQFAESLMQPDSIMANDVQDNIHGYGPHIILLS